MRSGGEDRKSKVEEMGMRREETNYLESVHELLMVINVSTVHQFWNLQTLQALHVARVWIRGLHYSRSRHNIPF